MKILKNLASALMVLPFVAALTACSDDDKYTSAEKLTNAQVFFSNELSEQVGLSSEENSFAVQLSRANTEGELTVKIVGEDEDGLFTIPEQATFADGETTTPIVIGYDPTVMVAGEMHPITLSIADEQYTTPYGVSKYVFEAGIRQSWATNADEFAENGGVGDFPLGEGDAADKDENGNIVIKGDYTYNGGFFDGEDPGLPISFAQNASDPNKGQFMIEHWAYDQPLVIDGEYDEATGLWNLRIPSTFTGYTHSSYGPVYAGDYISYYAYRNLGELTWDILVRNNLASYYDPEKGLFTMMLCYYVDAGMFGDGFETFQIHGFYIPDYTTSPTFGGILKTPEEENQAVVDFTFGVDVTSAKYALTLASMSEDEVAEAIISGEIEATEITAGGRQYISMAGLEDDKYRVTVVAYDNASEPQGVESITFEFEAGGSSWESLGIGLWTEDLLTLLYSSDGQTPLEPEYYEVEILASTKKPGIYRVENPYADWGTMVSKYIEVNAEDPTHVYIPYTDLFDDEGVISIESSGAYYLRQGYSAEVIDANMSGCFGKLEDGVIGGWGAKRFYAYVDGELYNYGNGNGAFEIVLPEAYESEVKAQRILGKKNGKTKIASRRNVQKLQFTQPTAQAKGKTIRNRKPTHVSLKVK